MSKYGLSRRQLLQRTLAWAAAAPALSALLQAGTAAKETTAPAEAAAATPRGRVRGAIATPHTEGAAAAASILQQGGNAVDAAIAALMTLCVVEPGNVGFGGYGGSMILYLAAEKRVTAIDFDSRAPLALKPEVLTEKLAGRGYLAAGVPGVVAGMDLAHRKYGRLPWKQLTTHALNVAEHGFTITPGIAGCLERFYKGSDPVSRRALFPDDRVPAAGERWVPKDLARLIRVIADGGAEAFYRGEVARATVRQFQENGGVLAWEDFKSFQAQEVEPVQISYRGHDIYTPPVPSGGLTSLSILKTLEQFDLASFNRWGTTYFHLFAEASKLCWEERFRLFGDPEQVSFSVDELLSEEKAAERAGRIRRGRGAAVKPPPPEGQHTVNLVVIDQEHNVVSLTATHGGDMGSHVAIDGYGLVLGHGISRFTLTKGSPNYPAPGKRMQHNMCPALILRDGKPWAGYGLPGGRHIVSVTAQLAVNLIDHGTGARDTLTAPRIHIEGEEPLRIDPAVSDVHAAELAALGHEIKRVSAIGGPANVALIDPVTGEFSAAASKGGDTFLVLS